MSDVDSKLVTQFNQAGQLSRDGEHASSLSAYRSVLAKSSGPKAAHASQKFIATVRMRIGFCLMDLGRYEEARSEFLIMAPLVPSLSTEGRYEYQFAYGNTLGSLGKLDEMFSELIQAVSLAEDMDDYCLRPAACWANILTHALKAKAWKFLEAKASIALNNARLRGMAPLANYAGEMLGSARRALEPAR